MTLDALIILSGAFVAILPFLGFPVSWDRVMFLIAGIFIIALGVALRRSRVRRRNERSEVYSIPEGEGSRDHDRI